MHRLVLFFSIALLCLSQAVLAGSLVGYKDHEISIKLDETLLSQLDRQAFSQGRTGLIELDQFMAGLGVDKISNHFTGSRLVQNSPLLQSWLKVHFRNPQQAETMAKRFAELQSVVRADAIPIHEVYATPNDPQVSTQWHINQANDADIDAYEAWDLQTGNPDVIVTVMDTGVEWFHNDLAGSLADQNDRMSIHGNMWVNSAELADTSSALDEDGNGFNDDWIGWDFVTGNPNLLDLGDDYDVADNDPRDVNGHGTHCSGNVGAINNNSVGVCSAGGGWGEDVNGYGNGVRVMALRIGWSDFPSGRVSMDFAASAFVYAHDNGARIACCSWGSSSYGPLETAVNLFIYGQENPAPGTAKVGLIFVAAGNSSSQSTDYLTGRGDCVSVAATQEDDNAASFTNYGNWISISAPGNNIYSTAVGGGYVSYSGTSMATPISAGVTALVWSYNPLLPADDVESYIYAGADNIDAHLDSVYIGKMGAGRISARGALDIAVGTSGVQSKSKSTPYHFALQQNYPNPFNPTTVIRYQLAAAGPVKLALFDALGQQVQSLVKGVQQAGAHQVSLDGHNLAGGIYFYRLQSGNQSSVRRMLLLK